MVDAVDRASGGFPERQGPFTAKPDEVWVMGDNRNNSHDSRMWWGGEGGGVPYANVHGRALFVWLAVANGLVDWSRFGLALTKPKLPPAFASLAPALEACLRLKP